MSNSEIDNLIRRKCHWENLPQHAKQVLGNSKKEYESAVLTYSLRNQLRFRGSLVKHVFKEEKKYYENMLHYSRQHLMVYPYHLSDVIVKGLKVTPFQYYIEMVDEILSQERSYDSLPNFTAADCLRLLGIGRNQYIDLINQCKASKRMFLWSTVNRKTLLPVKPLVVQIDTWWIVNVGFVSVQDIKDCTTEEKKIIDTLIDGGPLRAGEADRDSLLSLHSIGLIYFDVPVNEDDYFSIPPLQGFVMNRVLGDYMETLLYKISVSMDEKTTVSELAILLNIDVSDAQNAISLFCRLGFAKKKKFEDPSICLHYSWKSNSLPFEGSFEEAEFLLSELDIALSELSSPKRSMTLESMSNGVSFDEGKIAVAGRKVAFLFDSTLTAYLMMGNLSSGLKTHAVTMFEVGKLTSESTGSLLDELDKIQWDDGEGEAKRYYDHAYNLKKSIQFLLNESSLRREGLDTVELDLVHYASLKSLDCSAALRLLRKNYYMLFSMAPLDCNAGVLKSLSLPHFGPPSPEFCSPWLKLFIYNQLGCGPPSVLFPKGTKLRKLSETLLQYERLLVTFWGQNSNVVPIQNALVTILEGLCFGAVFVQGYSKEAAIMEKHVALPLVELDDGNQLKAVKKLHHVVDLTLICGYLTLIDSPVEKTSEIHERQQITASGDDSQIPAIETCNQIKETEQHRMHEQEWEIFSMDLGIPLFDQELNSQIFRGINQNALLSGEKSAKAMEYMYNLNDKLSVFVKKFKSSNPEVNRIENKLSSQPTPPTRIISFFDGEMKETYYDQSVL